MPEFEKDDINQMLELEVIELAQTECASPIVLAPKKDCTLRFFVEYKTRSAVTLPDSYSIPSIDHCIDLLGDVKIYSTLDASRRY